MWGEVAKGGQKLVGKGRVGVASSWTVLSRGRMASSEAAEMRRVGCRVARRTVRVCVGAYTRRSRYEWDVVGQTDKIVVKSSRAAFEQGKNVYSRSGYYCETVVRVTTAMYGVGERM